MVRNCMDVMMGYANRATIRSLRRLPLKRKSAILCRNMTEMKADIDMVMEENQTLERKNEELEKKHEEMESALEGKKNKVQTMDEKLKELQKALEKEKKNNEKECELMKEKRKVIEARLPKQLKFSRKEAVKEYLSSKECGTKFNVASATVLQNGFKIGIAQVRELLMDDDELVPELEKIKINPKVKYEKELIPSIEGDPIVWSEDYEADPMRFINEWGIEVEVELDPPCPAKVVRPKLPISASESPSTDPPLLGSNVRPPHPEVS
ncbi:hypothetical protein Dimus_015831 [Dionaea muscipula]